MITAEDRKKALAKRQHTDMERLNEHVNELKPLKVLVQNQAGNHEKQTWKKLYFSKDMFLLIIEISANAFFKMSTSNYRVSQKKRSPKSKERSVFHSNLLTGHESNCL